MYREVLILVYLAFGLTCAFAADNTQLSCVYNLEPIKAADRILVLAPHPDDEAIGCAGIIQEAVRAGADAHVLCLTNGDNNEFAFIVYEKRIPILPAALVHMGEVRRGESVKAMRMLGLDEYRLIYLGYPDFGTLRIFRDYWQEGKPYKSFLTRATSVPYKDDQSFGSPYIGGSIINDLKNILLRYRPNKIFVSHPADLNSDHRALHLFLQVALADLAGDFPRPQVYNYLVHWKAWPLPRHYHPELPLLPPGEFRETGSGIRWLKRRLPAQDLVKKHKAILAYKSQTESSAFYLLAFARKNELFAVYPDIDINITPEIALKKPASLKEKILAFFGLSEGLPEISLMAGRPVAADTCPVTYGSGDNSFLIKMRKRKDIDRTLKTVIYLFGYSRKTPFARMPKITMFTKHTRFKILDGSRVIAGDGVSLELRPEELVVKIPLSLLGDPDFILASVHGNAGISHVDTLSFRKVNVINAQP